MFENILRFRDFFYKINMLRFRDFYNNTFFNGGGRKYVSSTNYEIALLLKILPSVASVCLNLVVSRDRDRDSEK